MGVSTKPCYSTALIRSPQTQMYLRRFSIENIRSIRNLSLDFEKSEEAGWHVILGTNGAGKSSVIRSVALLVMGQREAYAARQDFSRWINSESDTAIISGVFSMDDVWDSLAGGGQPPKRPISGQVVLDRQEDGFSRTVDAVYTGDRIQRTIWGGGQGWFAASFGPFRRFTGGDRIYDRLFVSNKRLAPHLTALGEDVALTEALGWLTSLYVQSLQDAKSGQNSSAAEVLSSIIDFINKSGFFPFGAKISDVTNDNVMIVDGNRNSVPIDQLSDGYRSALSLTIELVRQMFELYGIERFLRQMRANAGVMGAPGIVAIDEVDAHLHPTWQRDIGRWLRRAFPRVQFIVTTHSPIVCRAVADPDGRITGSVWRLPAPGSDRQFQRVDGEDLRQLVYGDILDAYGTELFGEDVSISQAGAGLRERLASLNAMSLRRELNQEEARERRELRATFPAQSGLR